ncbi:Asp-tRNA(Asn)/Glu-tRNA(Gln) amidotransferase subunit GatB [Candidatus Kaiserbacteria bacterium]|nr:Asp-tRNA(Asn)/Glu-tRNA(Gln) amidotransferase subunit GatB [Candidatus Kaiserbacteria bacterium]
MSTYTPTIGIEVHAELNTKSKMFCSCVNDPHAAEANTHICPVCLAHPGTLPAVNKEAVKKVLLVGKALGGTLAAYSEFDRKNYFYPDIPKAYQLSQYAYPFVSGGELAGVAITRVHLEEDTARSQHEMEGSIVDFNRAGVPLMELVTEPVIHDAKTAATFAKELQLLLRTLGISGANMERGEMRVEANISISDTDELGTKVEVKNLNSFKAVEQAIEYEIKRQTELLNSNERIIQETRGWDENKSRTFSQRSKETAEDYRYFPDPDIPKYDLKKVPEFENSRLQEIMPKLPLEIREQYLGYGVKGEQIEILLADKQLLNFMDAVTAEMASNDKKVRQAVNYVTSDVVGLLQDSSELTLELSSASSFASLITLLDSGEINSRVAKDLLAEVLRHGSDPKQLAEEKGLLQASSTDELLPIVTTVIAENPEVVSEYKGGKEAVLQFLVGQGMKATRGSANPAVLTELLKEQMK